MVTQDAQRTEYLKLLTRLLTMTSHHAAPQRESSPLGAVAFGLATWPFLISRPAALQPSRISYPLSSWVGGWFRPHQPVWTRPRVRSCQVRDWPRGGTRRKQAPRAAPGGVHGSKFPGLWISGLFLTRNFLQHPLDNRFARRPGYNETGKRIKVEVNQYAMIARKDNFKVFQYDVRYLCPAFLFS